MKHTIKLTTKKDLIQKLDDHKALQSLHKVFNYDFESPLTIYKGNGYFTNNSIITSFNIDTLNDNVCMICKDTTRAWECWNVVKVNNTFTTDIQTRCTTLNTFYTKKEFEQKRKNSVLDWFVIVQNKQYIKPYQRKKIDYLERFKLLNYSTYSNGVIYRVKVRQGTAIHEWSTYRRTYDINALIDKSGYLMYDYNNALKDRLRTFKTNNDISRLKKDSFKNEIETIKKDMNALRINLSKVMFLTDNDETLTDCSFATRKLSRLYIQYKHAIDGSITRYSVMKELILDLQTRIVDIKGSVCFKEVNLDDTTF